MTKIKLAALLFALCSINAQAQTKNDNMSNDSTSLMSKHTTNTTTMGKAHTYGTGSMTVPGRITSCQDGPTETTTASCPGGQLGAITYSRPTKQCSDGINGSTQAGNWTEVSRSCYNPPPPAPPEPPCYSTRWCNMNDALYTWSNGWPTKIPGTDGQGPCLQELGETYCDGRLKVSCNYTVGSCWTWF